MEKNSSGRWQKIRWEQFHEAVRDLAGQLWRAGLRPGDHVALMMPNGVRWEMIQHAVYRIGGIVVGLDRNDPAERIGDLFSLFDATALIVEDRRLLERIPAAVLKALPLVLADLAPATVSRRHPGTGTSAVLPAARSVAPDQAATVIFTSGTTGRPKALAYSHRQLALAIATITPLLADLPDQAHTVCWLPLANPFQRMTNWCAMAANWKTFMVSEPAKILEQVREIRPHFLVAVPRFYEKLHAGIRQRLEAMPGRLKSAAAWAQDVGARYRRAAAQGERVPLSLKCKHRVAERLVLRRVRRAMGGRLRYFISGSAPLPESLIDAFAALGWPILEAYGISENIIPMAMNAPGACCPGSVGRPLANNEIRIAGDGEILVKGPGVALAGADPQADGFLKTGDLGVLDDEGFLRITGRKSDIFKLSTGRKIVPRPLEEALGRIDGVEHCVAVGASRKFVVALLNVPEEQWRWLNEQHAGAEGARVFLRRRAQQVCAHLPDYSRPVEVAVVNECFSPQSGELTANLKLRRDFVLRKHAAVIEEIYQRAERGTAAEEK